MHRLSLYPVTFKEGFKIKKSEDPIIILSLILYSYFSKFSLGEQELKKIPGFWITLSNAARPRRSFPVLCTVASTGDWLLRSSPAGTGANTAQLCPVTVINSDRLSALRGLARGPQHTLHEKQNRNGDAFVTTSTHIQTLWIKSIDAKLLGWQRAPALHFWASSAS